METAQVIKKFLITSLVLWGLPLIVLYAFNNYLKPDVAALSPRLHTLLSGCLAVLSVNMVIGVYIFLAMKEPKVSAQPNPDPHFVAQARMTLEPTYRKSSTSNSSTETEKTD